MKITAMFFPIRALGALLFLSLAAVGGLRAQGAAATPAAATPAAANPAAAKSAVPEELGTAELLKSYLQVREQLHATQLAIVNSRIETEAAARVQAAAITERLEGIKSAMAVERERYQAETQRLNAERQLQRAETERSIRTVLWVSAIFGGVGLVAMLMMPVFQWRAMNRMAAVTALRPQLGASERPALMPGEAALGPADNAVALANQRLTSVIERMERRIFELEHTAVPPAATVTTMAATTGSDSPVLPAPANDREGRIAALLGKGRALLSADKPRDALSCYNEVLKLDLNHPEALVKKGAALERLKQDDEALQCYDRAIKADRRMTVAYLYKGGVCNRLERYEEALKCYEQALQAEEETKKAGLV